MAKGTRLATMKPRLQVMADRFSRVPVLGAGSAERRIRGTTLQNIRKAHFDRHPLCVACLAMVPQRISLATELDHIIPLHQGGLDSMDPFLNRQGLCQPCHLQKSQEEMGSGAHQ